MDRSLTGMSAIGPLPGIDVTIDDAVALVTLRRPQSLNAPDRAMHTALVAVWRELAAADAVDAVVLTGDGRAFSAGSDPALLRSILDDEATRAEVLAEAGDMLVALAELPMPVVAAVNGPVVGLGCSLVGLCDLVVMGRSAFFLDPHVPVGLGGGDGVALVWPALTSLLLAKELALLGNKLDADRAFAAGLVNRVVDDDAVLPTAMALAERLAAQPRQAVRESKILLNAALRARLEAGIPVALAIEGESLRTPANRRALEAAVAATGSNAGGDEEAR